MSNLIQLKRNTYTATGDPTALAYGELGWNNNNGGGGNLWIGSQRDNNSPSPTITEELINKPVLGTSSQITVLESDASFTVSLPTTTSVTNLQVSGNLTVSGTTTTVATNDLVVKDSLIYLAKDQVGSPSLDSGFVVERGNSNNVGLIWDESADEFSFITTDETGGTDGNVSITAQANVRALGFYGNLTGNVTGNITGTVTGNATNVTGTVAIGNGGTGATTVSSARTALGVTAQFVQDNHVSLNSFDINTSSVAVIDVLTVNNNGHVTNATTRNLSLADFGTIDGGTFS